MASAMCLGSIGAVSSISDRAGYFQDAVVGAVAHSLLCHGALEQAFAIGGEFAEGADVAGRHLRIAVDLLAGRGEALELLLAGAHDPLANLRGTFRFVGVSAFLCSLRPGRRCGCRCGP
jgi:hypothetical protein